MSLNDFEILKRLGNDTLAPISMENLMQFDYR